MCNRIIVVLAIGTSLWMAAPLRAAQVQCQSFNDCMTDAVCQNGVCTGGVAVVDGSPCNTAGPCMTDGTCLSFPGVNISICIGTPVDDGTPCALLPHCFTSGQCSSGECMGSTPVTCADDDPCTADFCNPQDGQCLHPPQCVTSDCVTSNSCDAGGTCHPVFAQNGKGCNNGNVCTGNDQCMNGECLGTPIEKITPGGATATPSQTPTATPPASTATPTLVPTEVVTETPTGVPGETATPTELVEASPTPTTVPTAVCVGDCNSSNDVTVDELLTMVNIALGNADVSTCLPGDANHDNQITIDEILTAVNNALNGCPLV
jgi:hypothetical protein